MADVAVGQQTEASNAAAATTLVINITPAAAGSSLHLPITCGTGFTINSVASSPSLTWTQRNAVDDGNQALCDWTADGVTAAAHTITITFSGSAPYRGAFAKEIVNTSGYDAAASAAHAAAVTASPGTGADGITTGNTSALSAQPALISAATIPTTTVALATAGTGFTSDGVGWSFGGNTGTSESKRVTATTALAATFTAPSNVPFDSVASVFLELTAATATTFTGPSTGVDDVQSTDFTVGANGTITGTVTCTFTNSLSGTWTFSTRDISSGTPTQTVKYTPSVAGTHVLGVTDNGGLTDATSINYVVASVSRPSAVTPNTWTDEAGGTLVVADINDGSDSTGAKDPAGASYPVLAFTMDTPMAASVAQTCYFRGNDVTAGKQIRQVLFANDGTTVVATGAWKTMTGSLATYSDTLTPTATAYKGEIQTQAVPTAVYGVIWPSNLATNGDVRLNWTGSASVSRTAQTIIWKSKYTAQNGYYAVWWRLPDAAATFGATEWYCGTHPFPCDGSVNGAGQATGGTGGSGSVQYAEIATIGAGVDYITSPSAANGGPFLLVADVWVTEAATVEVISGTTLRHTYWPDITNTTSFIRQDRTLASLDTPTAERVVFGGSPWRADTPTAGKTDESASGTFRYWKMFSAALSITDIATEAASESDSAVTTAGIASEFYSNINPTPTDVTDKSGNGHDPAWANSNRPTLYTG